VQPYGLRSDVGFEAEGRERVDDAGTSHARAELVSAPACHLRRGVPGGAAVTDPVSLADSWSVP
jgi:hypothetical protein